MSSIEVVLKLVPQQQANRQRAVLTRTVPVILLELAPDAVLRAEQFIQAETIETEISNVPLLTNSSTNTDSCPTHSRGMRHYDGGWPNNVDVEEREGRIKHCKKVEREEGYLSACHNLVTVTKPFLRLSEAIDIFEVYDRFTAAPTDPALVPSAVQRSGADADRPAASTEAVPTATAPPVLPAAPTIAGPPTSESEGTLSVCMKFAAPLVDCRVSQVAFTCGSDSEMMAVGYVRGAAGAELLDQPLPHVSDHSTTMAAAVWNLSSCVAPAHTLHSRYGGCSAVACCPKDPFQVVGGSVTGVVQVWDLRKGYSPDTAASSSSGSTTFHLPVMSNKRLESHTDAITDAKYVLSKGVDLMTCSLDGKVYFWDLRNLSSPLVDETLELGAPVTFPAKAGGSPGDVAVGGFDAAGLAPTATTGSNISSASLTPCYLDYDPLVGGIQQYLVGTAEGMVLACSRRGKKKSDRILHRYHASLSSVFTVQRNPALPKIFLTVGDWGWRLFGDEVPTPIMAGAPRQRQVTCGRWNTTRPSMLYTGTVSGHVEVWDLLRHGPKAPVEELCVSDSPLKVCLPHPNGRHVAVADDCGHMYLLSVPVRVSTTVAKERALFVASLEREYNRERALSGQRSTAAAAMGEGDLAADASDREALLFGVAGDLPRDVEHELAALADSYLSVTEANTSGAAPRGGSSLSVGRKRRSDSPLGGGGLQLQQSASSAFTKTLSMTTDPVADAAAASSFEAITERRRRSSVVSAEAMGCNDLSEEETQVPLHRKPSIAAGSNRIEGF